MKQILLILAVMVGQSVLAADKKPLIAALPAQPLEWSRVSAKGDSFVRGPKNETFRAWGFNYDHDESGRLLEDYWETEWDTVVADFAEMKALGANIVRIHLQLGKFMNASDQPNAKALTQLKRLIRLAENTGLYINLPGLGCYHKKDVPEWYDKLEETARWKTQARFWKAIAQVGSDSPAIFCYDLMNEPILPGKKKETEWLTGEFAGKHFVQRIALNLAGRTRQQVAQAWVEQLVAEIRRHDQRHMITVGVIPWALTFPGAKPLFYTPEIGGKLDFVSVHFYPEKHEVDKALKALAVYNVGKPLVIEEMFPLKCSLPELDQFVTQSAKTVDGWIGFYWGRTLENYRADKASLKSAVMQQWLEYFQTNVPAGNRSPREK
ncbi:MAG: cellulase family glycosylhydrolase [Candidatus Latescibacterota bacterium]